MQTYRTKLTKEEESLKINEEKREIAKSEKIKKSNSRFNLSENKAVKFLETNTIVIDGLIKHKNEWNKNTEDIRRN